MRSLWRSEDSFTATSIRQHKFCSSGRWRKRRTVSRQAPPGPYSCPQSCARRCIECSSTSESDRLNHRCRRSPPGRMGRPTGRRPLPASGNAARSMPPTTPGNDVLGGLKKLLPLAPGAYFLKLACDAIAIEVIRLPFHFQLDPNWLWFGDLCRGPLTSRRHCLTAPKTRPIARSSTEV
jgi:hypothetical protein